MKASFPAGRTIASWITLALLLMAGIQSFAQLPTGTILGTVKDPTESVVANAKITATNSDTGATRTATTASDGEYRFSALPVGNYRIEISAAGFPTAVQKGITLAVGQEEVLNFTLKVGSVTETVDVTSQAPLVDTTSSAMSALVGETTIAELPLNGRNYVDLTLLQPGITQHTQENAGQGVTGTMYSADGAPIRSNIVMLDGTMTVNQVGANASSVAGTTLGMDGIKEYRVITDMASAEYFSSMGSQTSISSQNGTNKFHGDVFDYLRNSALDARNYFDPQPDVLGGKRIPGFKRNQFGGAIGGPLRKDKTFVFANYEGVRSRTGNPLYVGVDNTFPKECWTPGSTQSSHSILMTNNPCAAYPLAFPPISVFWGLGQGGAPAADGTVNPLMENLANLFPYPNVGDSQFEYANTEKDREDFGQFRFDNTFSDKDNFFVRYTIDDAVLDRPDQYPQFHDMWTSRGQFLTLAENHSFTSHMLNMIRLSYARTNLNTITLPVNAAAAAQLTQTGDNGTSLIITKGVPQMVGLVIVPGLTTMGPSTVAPGYLIQNLLSLGDDVFWSKGKHSIKVGFLLNHYDDPMWNNLIYGSVNVLPTVGPPSGGGSGTPTDPYACPLCPHNLASTPGNLFLNGYAIGQSFQEQQSAYTPQSNTHRDYTFFTIGGYLQDDYRATPRLTVNLGLRYEMATVPSDKAGQNWGYSNIATGDLNCPGPTCIAQHGPIWQNFTKKNFSPRVGFAWDPFGTGRTSVRGGYGIYFDIANLGSKLGQQALGVPPTAEIENVLANYAPPPVGGGGFPFWPFVIPHQTDAPPCSPSNSQTGGFGPTFLATNATCLIPQLAGNDYRPKSTYMAQYNLTVQQQLPGHMALTVAYVGSRGIHLRRVAEGNPVIPCNMPGSSTAAADPTGCGATLANVVANGLSTDWKNGMNPIWDAALYPAAAPPGNSYRVNPNLPAYVKSTTDGDSWYNALQTSLNKQVSKGLQFGVTFTWSKLFDTTQGDIGSNDEGANFPSDPFNPRFDRGPTAFDAKFNLRVNEVYTIPNIHADGFLAGLEKGWKWSNIVSAQSGYPFECMTQYGTNPSNSEMGIEDIGGDLSNDRCNEVTAANLSYATGLNANAVPYNAKTVLTKIATPTENQWFNPNMFTMPVAGTLGTSARGLMRGPGQFDWDLSLVKDTHLKWLGEGGNLQFRAEVFNILNHTNFAFPYSNNFNANYQAIVSAHTGVNGSNVSPTAGQVTNTLINARQIQFALKFVF